MKTKSKPARRPNKADRLTHPTTPTASSVGEPLPMNGIGTSAGGLEAKLRERRAILVQHVVDRSPKPAPLDATAAKRTSGDGNLRQPRHP